MSELSNYLEQYVLTLTLKDPSKPAYLALYTTDPTDAGTGTECSWIGYVRQELSFGDIVDGVVSIDAAVTFPMVVNQTLQVTHIGIHDAPVNGNLLYHTILGSWDVDITGTLVFTDGSRYLANGDGLTIPISGIRVTLS